MWVAGPIRATTKSKFRVFWVVVPCSQVDIALMMEAVRTSETPVNIYLTTRQYIPEDLTSYTPP
jgi:hypothetical protein